MRKTVKSYQKKFNKIIRALNRNIANDDLWKGRFYFFQKNMRFEKLEDHSSGIMHIIIRAYDKKTGYYKDFIIEWAPYFACGEYRLWEIANRFIAQDSCVWEEEPRINKLSVPDWNRIRVKTENIGAYKSNYDMDYKTWKEKNNG